HHARERHDHRHRLHAVRRAVDLRPRGADAQGGRRGEGRHDRPYSRSRGGIMKARAFVAAFVAALAGAPASAEAAPAPPPAAEPGALLLDEAVPRAAEHNPDLAIVLLGTEDEASAVGETRTAFTPVFSTTLGRSSITTPPTNFLLGNA